MYVGHFMFLNLIAIYFFISKKYREKEYTDFNFGMDVTSASQSGGLLLQIENKYFQFRIQ